MLRNEKDKEMKIDTSEKKSSRDKGKTNSDHGGPQLCETSFIHLETGTMHIQKPQRGHVRRKKSFISATLSLHQVGRENNL